MNDILELAENFAKQIQNTKEYFNLQKAKKNNDADLELNSLIKKFNILTEKIRNLMVKGEQEKKYIDEKNIEVNKLYKKIMENKNMLAYNKATDEMNLLMNKINSILVAAANGQNLTACSNGEIFGCGSCGKCSGKN